MADDTISRADTLTRHDELPYDSLLLPEIQPDFLAAMARLHRFLAGADATISQP